MPVVPAFLAVPIFITSFLGPQRGILCSQVKFLGLASPKCRGLIIISPFCVSLSGARAANPRWNALFSFSRRLRRESPFEFFRSFFRRLQLSRKVLVLVLPPHSVGP